MIGRNVVPGDGVELGMTRTCVAATLMVLLTLTGCGAQAPSDGGGATEATAAPETSAASEASESAQASEAAVSAGPYDGEWQLQSGRDPAGDIPGVDDVTLKIAGGRFSGRTGCNSYDAGARITESRLRMRQVMRTLMACEPNLMATEERYLDALEAATRIDRAGNTLRISGDGIKLEFTPVVPDEPAAFEDTAWQLHTLGYGRGPSSTVSSTTAPGDLTFARDGTLSAHTGCRPITGRWTRDGDTVTVTDLPQGIVDCQVAGGQDDHIMTVLLSPFTVELDGRELWLQQAEGDLGMGYTAD